MSEKQETVETEEIEGDLGSLTDEDLGAIDPLDGAFPNEIEQEQKGEEKEETAPPAGTVESQESETGDKDTVPPTDDLEKQEPDDIAGIKAALAAEREKRKFYQQQAQQQPIVQQQEPEHEFDWSDPKNSLKTVEAKLENKFNQRFLNMSEAHCKQRHEDYDEKYQTFVTMAQQNPAIINTMSAQPDPAEWAYQQASKQMMIDQIGNDPESFEKSLEAKIEQRLIKKYGLDKKQELEDKIQQASGLPPSAASLPNAGNQSAGPKIYDDPLGAAWKDKDR